MVWGGVGVVEGGEGGGGVQIATQWAAAAGQAFQRPVYLYFDMCCVFVFVLVCMYNCTLSS